MKTRRPGFSLLEAIVALAILGGTILPLLALLGESLDRLHRADDSSQKLLVMGDVLEVVKIVNPAQQKEGEMDLGDVRIKWTSDLLIEKANNAGALISLGNYRVGYYKMVVTADHPDGREWFTLDLKKIGHVKQRNELLGR